MKWLYVIFLYWNIAMATCPDAKIISITNFDSLPQEIIWHDYIFMEVKGGLQHVEDESWEVLSWYAPLDIDKSDLDSKCRAKILQDINIAKLNVTLKHAIELPDNTGKYRCYYTTENKNIIFVANKQLSAASP